MDDLVVQCLVACDQSIQYRQPLLAELASSLHVQPAELYYQWVEQRWRHGAFRDGEWQYFFHGVECDLRNPKDGRFLRIDFGPRGITTAFIAWGVTQLIMTSKAPWREFPQLQSYLAEGSPPYNERSGSLERAGILFDKLEETGLITTAAPELLELEKRYTSRNGEGIAVVRLPEWVSERQRLDIHVANRNIITEKGKSLLATISATHG
jgi:hypothetical protein